MLRGCSVEVMVWVRADLDYAECCRHSRAGKRRGSKVAEKRQMWVVARLGVTPGPLVESSTTQRQTCAAGRRADKAQLGSTFVVLRWRTADKDLLESSRVESK